MSGCVRIGVCIPISERGSERRALSYREMRELAILTEQGKWADRWNSVWYGLPTDEFRAERADLVAACERIGRDPASVEVSAGIVIKDPRTIDENDGDGIVGDVDHIADAFAAWRDEGVDEVMCRLEPPSTDVVETIVRAAVTFRGSAAGQ